MASGTKIKCDKPEIKLFFVSGGSAARCCIDAHWEGPTAPKPWNRQVLPYFFVQTSCAFVDWFGLGLRYP